MKFLLLVFAMMLVFPASAKETIVIDPNSRSENLHAPSCETIPKQWKLIKEKEKEPGRIGYYVHFLRKDLRRCKLTPKAVGETNASLRKYQGAYDQIFRNRNKIPQNKDSAPRPDPGPTNPLRERHKKSLS